MTLILTEASKQGIAMAADSSVTFPNGRSLLGVQKLIPVRAINAGISAWGTGKVVEVDTDMWLSHFAKAQTDSSISLWQFAEKLAQALNMAFSQILPFNSGMHVAGFDTDENGTRYPAIYHVHNGHYRVGAGSGSMRLIQDEPIREFRAHRDFPPSEFSDGEARILRNGDFFIFGQLSEVMLYAFEQLRLHAGLEVPFPSNLETRGEYLRIWISFIAQIYRHSNFYPHGLDTPITGGGASIGGPISVLTIDDSGIRSFYTI